MFYSRYSSWLCDMIFVGDERGVHRIHLEAGEKLGSLQILDSWVENDDFFKDIRIQFDEYFGGKRKNFSIKMYLEGTDFQKRVWKELQKIPYGKVFSYKDIAVSIGNEKASRAIGMANGCNRLPIIIPCHRVVGSDGSLTGFAFGTDVKKRLLDFEKNSGFFG